MRPSLLKTASPLTGISSLLHELNHDVERSLEALLYLLDVWAKSLKDCLNNLYPRLSFVSVPRSMNRSMMPFEVISKSKLDWIALLWCWRDRDVVAMILPRRGNLEELADGYLNF